MTFTQQLLAALLLDLLIGDPERLPHPVRMIGRLAAWLESPCRRLIRSPRAAGILAVFLVVGSAGAMAWLMMRMAGLL
ncbi:MAG TPA: adenosylcobinamide-phosphate synthase, partial [Verrucomicrobia bacterium]|nr:adenosylcobinamide-phosphate synthase [Verrucomicrobiota bacterium]